MDLVMKTTHLINKEEMVSSWWRIGRSKNLTLSRFTKLWEQELWQRQSDLSLLVLVVNKICDIAAMFYINTEK